MIAIKQTATRGRPIYLKLFGNESDYSNYCQANQPEL